MKKKYTLLAIAALALSLFACEKEQVSIDKTSTTLNLTPEQQLAQLDLPLILFQYSYINLESGEESGWFIDRSGNLNTYKTTRSPGAIPSSENEKLLETDLTRLYALSTEQVTTIEKEELLSRVRQGMALSKRFLSNTEMDENTSWAVAFYAFTKDAKTSGQSGHSSCNSIDYNNDTPSETRINRMIVGLSGHINRHETSTYATSLHQWFMALNEGL